MNRIVKDPKILGGRPYIRGTKVPCELILGLLADGNSFKEICTEFSKVTKKDIQATLSYARDLIKREVAPRGVSKNELIIYIDGASRGNPGPAGVGVVSSTNRLARRKPSSLSAAEAGCLANFTKSHSFKNSFRNVLCPADNACEHRKDTKNCSVVISGAWIPKRVSI